MASPVTPLPFPSDDDASLIAGVEAAIASLEAGQKIPYEDVRRWLLSWGTENPLPPPECR